MASFPFAGLDHATLAQELARPIERVSIIAMFGKFPSTITLWHTDGTGLRIHSEMCDVAEKLEVGVLHFASVKAPSVDDVDFDVPPTFRKGAEAFALSLQESETAIQSGVILRALSGEKIVIVAAAMPCNLHFEGIPKLQYKSRPEYELDQYTILLSTQT